MSRLSKRLERIEQETRAEPTEDANEMLVSLLGRLDALFWPWRTRKSFRAAVRDREVDYLAGLRGISAKADGKEAWKSAHYTRNELIDRGLVTAARSGGQVTTLFLTPQGEADARAMAGLPGLFLASGIIARMQAALGFDCHGRRWVSESSFWDTNLVDNPSDWDHLTEVFLPLLTRGVVVSNCDGWNIVYYSLDESASTPEIVNSDLTKVPGMHSRYIDAFDTERSALERLENTGCGLVIPIACTLDPWRHAFSRREPQEDQEAEVAENGK